MKFYQVPSENTAPFNLKRLTARRWRMRAKKTPRRTLRLSFGAIAGLNTLATSFSKQKQATSFSFIKNDKFKANHNQRSSSTFSFPEKEQDVVLGAVLSASGAYAEALTASEAGAQQQPRDNSSIPNTFWPHHGAFEQPDPADESAFSYASCSRPPPKNIEVERLSLPDAGSAPCLAMCDLLPPEIAKFYSDPTNIILPHNERPPAKGRACVMIDKENYQALLTMLFDRSMVAFRKDVHVTSGLFAVDKTDGLLRMIADLRAANAMMRAPAKTELPNPDILRNLRARRGRRLIVCGRDISNMYHRIRVPDWLIPWLAWPAVRVGDLPFAVPGFNDPDTRVHPCLLSLPMGWSHSVFIAQKIHERVMEHYLHISRDDLFLKHNDLTLHECRILVAIYIDDTFFVCLNSDTNYKKLCGLVRRYEYVLKRLGLPDKVSKRFGPSRGGVCETLGIQINADTLRFGVAPLKLEKLKLDTQRLLRPDVIVSGYELSSIVGKWTWAFLAKRGALSVFAAVYLFIGTLEDRSDKLWKSAQEELEVACQIAPLLFSQLDTPWSPNVYASDASSTGGGVVWRPVDDSSLPALRCSTRFTNAYPPFDGAFESQRETLIDATLRGHSPWRTTFDKKWGVSGEHITALEARAAYLAARHAFFSHTPEKRKMHLLLCDSTAVVGAAAKGRCSSRNLLRRMRPFFALALATGHEMAVVWIETERNPADDPSRGVPVRAQLLPQLAFCNDQEKERDAPDLRQE